MPGMAHVSYEEDRKVLMLHLGNKVIEVKGVDIELFAELCAAFGYFRDRFNDKKEVIRYRSIDHLSAPGLVIRH